MYRGNTLAPTTPRQAYQRLGELLNQFQEKNTSLFSKLPVKQQNSYQEVCWALTRGQGFPLSTFYCAMGFDKQKLGEEVHDLVETKARRLFNSTPQGVELRNKRLNSFFYTSSLAYCAHLFIVFIVLIIGAVCSIPLGRAFLYLLAQYSLHQDMDIAFRDLYQNFSMNVGLGFLISLLYFLIISINSLIISITSLIGINSLNAAVSIVRDFAENLRAEDRSLLAGIEGIKLDEYRLFSSNPADRQREEIFQRPIYNQEHLDDIDNMCCPLFEQAISENCVGLEELYEEVRTAIRPLFSAEYLRNNQNVYTLKKGRDLIELYVILGLIVGQNTDRSFQKSACSTQRSLG